VQFVDLLRNSLIIELKTTVTVYIRNISQADLQKVFVNKIKRVQPVWTLVDITFSTFHKCTATLQTHFMRQSFM